MLTIASVHESVLDLIGNTPLVDVSVLSPNPDVRILAKLENQNPFGSVKDRIAKNMIEAAEKAGHLAPGQTIVEPSSGNTGIALEFQARRGLVGPHAAGRHRRARVTLGPHGRPGHAARKRRATS